MPCKRLFVFYFMEFVPFDSQNWLGTSFCVIVSRTFSMEIQFSSSVTIATVRIHEKLLDSIPKWRYVQARILRILFYLIAHNI